MFILVLESIGDVEKPEYSMTCPTVVHKYFSDQTSHEEVMEKCRALATQMLEILQTETTPNEASSESDGYWCGNMAVIGDRSAWRVDRVFGADGEVLNGWQVLDERGRPRWRYSMLRFHG